MEEQRSIVSQFREARARLSPGVQVWVLAFLIAGAIYLAQPESALLDLGGPWFWLFSGIILFGGVIENMRNIALRR